MYYKCTTMNRWKKKLSDGEWLYVREKGNLTDSSWILVGPYIDYLDYVECSEEEFISVFSRIAEKILDGAEA